MAEEFMNVTNIEVPFPTRREAEIVYNALRVDINPTRKQIKKVLSLLDNKLVAEISAPDAKSLRIGMNSFMELLILSVETMEKFGPPRSEQYDH